MTLWKTQPFDHKENVKATILHYANQIATGEVPANKWIYAAICRFNKDLERDDIYFDWDEAAALDLFFKQLTLVGEYSDKPFALLPWQLFVVTNIRCWKLEDGRMRHKLSLIVIARGSGKTTLMSGLALYDLTRKSGQRTYCIANTETQAGILLNTARTMASHCPALGLLVTTDAIEDRTQDTLFTTLPAMERSLQGLSPSMFVADEAADFRGRFLSALLTAGVKRKEVCGVVISTPSGTSENHFTELVKNAEGVLDGSIVDDSVFQMLFGLDENDELSDESCWEKANPSMPYGQPELQSIRRAWNTMKTSPMGRAEFMRFHACRATEDGNGMLDMSLYDDMVDPEFDEDTLLGRACYCGLDLSKSGDMTALVLIFPLDNGKCYIKCRSWWPSENLQQRELDFRVPVRVWHKEGWLDLSQGREIDYEQIRVALNEYRKLYDIKCVAYDAWGSQMLAQTLIADGLPLQVYRQAISTLGPGTALFVNHWLGRKFILSACPIFRSACSIVEGKKDLNGNIRPTKSRSRSVIDPVVAAIMALHSYGGVSRSNYEIEAEQQGLK